MVLTSAFIFIMAPLSVVRDLGIFLDSELSMTSHITKISTVCYCHLRRLKQVRRVLGETLQLVLCRLSLSVDWIIVTQSWQACHSQRWPHFSACRVQRSGWLKDSVLVIISQKHDVPCTGSDQISCHLEAVHPYAYGPHWLRSVLHLWTRTCDVSSSRTK